MADDMMQRGARMIERVRAGSLAHSVEYRRLPENVVVTVKATSDESNVELVQEGQVTGTIERLRDFLIAADSLVVGDDLRFDPKPGDCITETIDETEVEYEVVQPDGSPCWSFDDSMNLRIRVHTRRKSATA